VSFFPATLPGGYNSTAYQEVYDGLVSSTSCLSTLGSGTSLSCLRSLPFSDLNAALNTSADGYGPFVPIIDNDLIATYPSVQLSSGKFVRAPLLIEANTDERTSFGIGFGPNGTDVNSDAQWLDVLNSINIPPDSQAAATISYLYPNIQGLGILSLATFPWVIPPDSNCSSQLGSQFRCMTSCFGAQSSSHQEEQPSKHGQRTKSPATATASTSSSTESLPAWAQPISKKLHSSSTTSAAKGTPPTHLEHD
jgi:hypothetical protein